MLLDYLGFRLSCSVSGTLICCIRTVFITDCVDTIRRLPFNQLICISLCVQSRHNFYRHPAKTCNINLCPGMCILCGKYDLLFACIGSCLCIHIRQVITLCVSGRIPGCPVGHNCCRSKGNGVSLFLTIQNPVYHIFVFRHILWNICISYMISQSLTDLRCQFVEIHLFRILILCKKFRQDPFFQLITDICIRIQDK